MKPIDATTIADLLNEMMIADPVATHSLMVNRMPCNNAMASHPHVIVDQLGLEDRTVVGMLGVLNGLLSSIGSDHRVAMAFSESTGCGTGHKPLLGFVAVKASGLQEE